MRIFQDRRQAGRRLAEELSHYAGRDDVIVLALPRGGVPVGYEVARRIGAPLDVFLVRKLGTPGQPELGMGAIATGGVRVMNDDVVGSLGIAPEQIEQVAEREGEELRRRQEAYRGDRPEPKLEGRVAILVDDGLATGATMKAAVRAVRAQAPQRIVVGVGTAPPRTAEEFRSLVDEFVCLVEPAMFMGVGGSYADFSQTSDAEVRRLLEGANAREQQGGAGGGKE
jgi:predicted phosphoribosyltransferase